MQAALERRLAHAGDLGRVFGGQALDVAQHDGGPPVRGQLVERPLEYLLELAAEGLGLGAEVRRLRERGDRIVAIRVGLGPRRRAAREAPLRFVERDPVEPGRELRALLETREAAPGAQEHLLGHLVGLARLQTEAAQRAVYAVSVERDQLRERVLVAGPS